MLAWVNFGPELRGLDITARMDRLGQGFTFLLAAGWWMLPGNVLLQLLAFRVFRKLSGWSYIQYHWLVWFFVYLIYLQVRR
jgi:hypothetical protein